MGKRVDLFNDFCENTTFHGFIDYFVAKIVWRVFWVIVIVLATAAVVYELRMVVLLYLSKPILTDFDLKSPDTRQMPQAEVCLESAIDPIKVFTHHLPADLVNNLMAWREDATPWLVQDDVIWHDDIVVFPHVTPEMIEMLTVPKTDTEARQLQIEINMRPPLADKRTQAMRPQLYHRAFAQLQQTWFKAMQACCDYFTLNYQNLEAFRHDYDLELSNDKDGPIMKDGDKFDSLDIRKLWRAVAYSNREVVLQMMFADELINEQVPVTVAYSYDQAFGQCYLLDTRAMQQHASAQGLAIMLNTHRAFTWTDYPNSLDGITLRLQPDGFNPTVNRLFNIAGSGPLGLSQVVDISLKADSYHMQVNEAEEKCRDDMDREMSRFGYTGSACRTECLLRASRDLCSCTVPIDVRFELQPGAHRHCINRVCADSLEQLTDEHQTCLNSCATKCNYVDFKATVSYQGFPSQSALYKMMGINQGIDFKTTNFFNKAIQQSLTMSNPEIGRFSAETIIVHLSFANLEHFEITQKEAMTLDAFVSNLGGQLGLFLGASIISIIQLLLYVATALGCLSEPQGSDDDEQQLAKPKLSLVEKYDSDDLSMAVSHATRPY